MKCQSGFTIIELVVIMILIGILAISVLPKLNSTEYQTVSFQDRAVSALRHAQKTATSHRRLVCVAFTASSVTLTIATAKDVSVCSTALRMPNGDAAVISGNTTSAIFNPVPAALFFQPDGRGTSDGAGSLVVDLNLLIAGQAIRVAGNTGYVQ